MPRDIGPALAPLLPAYPPAGDARAGDDVERAARRESVGIALKKTAGSFCASAVVGGLPGLVPKPVLVLGAGVMLEAIQNHTERRFVYTPPRNMPAPTAGQKAIGDALTYFPFIPFLALQAYGCDKGTWTGKQLTQVQEGWKKLWGKHPLTAMIGKYPIGSVGTRVLAQLASAYAGALLRTGYQEKFLKLEAQPSGSKGRVSLIDAAKSVVGHPADYVPYALIFALPAAAAHPAAREKLATLFTSHFGKVVGPESVAVSALAAAAVVANALKLEKAFTDAPPGNGETGPFEPLAFPS